MDRPPRPAVGDTDVLAPVTRVAPLWSDTIAGDWTVPMTRVVAQEVWIRPWPEARYTRGDFMLAVGIKFAVLLIVAFGVLIGLKHTRIGGWPGTVDCVQTMTTRVDEAGHKIWSIECW